MNELEQLEKIHAELGKEIERLKAKPCKKRERVYGKPYWFITSLGEVVEDIDGGRARLAKRFALGNYFYTKEAAIKALNRRLAEQRIFDALREHEGDWTVDWGNYKQSKYHISYTHDDKEFYIYSCNSLQAGMVTRYYSTEEACQWVMDNMEDDLRIVWGID